MKRGITCKIPETLRRAGRSVRQGQEQTDRGYRPACRAEVSDRILPERAARPRAADGVPGYRLACDGQLHHRPKQKDIRVTFKDGTEIKA